MSPRKIAEMSRGEVVNAQTFDVYTQKPIKGGLSASRFLGLSSSVLVSAASTAARAAP